MLGSRLRIMASRVPQIATTVKPKRVSAAREGVGGGHRGRGRRQSQQQDLLPFILTQISIIPVPETLHADSIYKQILSSDLVWGICEQTKCHKNLRTTSKHHSF